LCACPLHHSADAPHWWSAAPTGDSAMFSTRRGALALLTFGSVAMAMTSGVHAQSNYPTKAITIVVPYTAGGNLDVVTRLIGTSRSSTLGQPVIIDNKAGAGGLIGHELVARAQPDGYTLVTTANGSYAVTPKLAPKRSFQPADFAPIGSMAVTPLVVEVPANS